MNFLSHYYFDRHISDPERIMGMVLPDLVKNAKKEWSLRPEKAPERFEDNYRLQHLLAGWKRHLEVDKHFHSSDFFCRHTQNIRAQVSPFLVTSEVRPSFVAHISLELMLDSLLLTEDIITTSRFYQFLAETDRPALNRFLQLNMIADTEPFFRFLDEFISSKYLNSYSEPGHITYAVGRICMRIWPDPFTETQKLQLTAVLLPYLEKLTTEFMQIFDEIEKRLTPYT